MTLSEIQSLIGQLTSDPNHDRYALSDINAELDNSQNKWNIDAKIIKFTATITIVDGTRQYSLFNLITGNPIAFTRVTHKGIDLKKRSKSWMDLYTATDWTQDIGTPRIFFIEDPNAQTTQNQGDYITVYPTPQSGDAGANLVLEYCAAHTSMLNSTDVPFSMSGFYNSLMRPFDWGLAYDVSSRLLVRDPSEVNAKKQSDYGKIAKDVFDQVVQNFKELDQEEPKRLRGGRYW